MIAERAYHISQSGGGGRTRRTGTAPKPSCGARSRADQGERSGARDSVASAVGRRVHPFACPQGACRAWDHRALRPERRG